MPANYVLLGEVTLGASAASVTFSNIPQSGYTDLKVVASVRSTKVDTTDYIYFTFSGSSSYAATKVLYGSGSGVGSFNWSTVSGITGGIINAANNTASTFSSVDIYIPNYTASQYKSVSIDTVQEGNTGSGIYATLMAGLSNSNTAISTITFAGEGGSFVAGSTFYLYGLAAVGTTPVIAPFASGGDIITNDGTYWIHTFLSSGTFTANKTLTCDYLVVAGGGGGGGDIGAGGGAGGLRSTVTATGGGGSLESSLSVAVQAYPITVGAGGATIVSGSNSTFSTITSTGGGYGGGNTGGGTNGVTGGSGGGGGGGAGSTTSGGSGTANQGFAGHSGTSSGTTSFGGGGGGASAAATNVNGANGVAVSITGSSVTYAGGGGGGAYNNTPGTGGTGGGGAGQSYFGTGKIGFAGTANTGGGGGGGSAGGGTAVGGAGGSGIVIIRYPIV